MKVHYIADEHAARSVAQRLASRRRLALDCEAAGYHRYSDQLCLVQLSGPGDTWLIDALALDASRLLRSPLEDPGREIVMHGASYDLRLLSRDLGIRVRGVFDTQVAAALLGESALGLSALLERCLGVHLPKKYQRADWAMRPLPAEMLEYAAADTRHLAALADILRARLDEKERLAWASEEFRWLERTVSMREDPDPDPATNMKNARHLAPRALQRLRALWTWRDEVARRKDRAPFRVAADNVLLQLAESPPRSIGELGRRRGLSPVLARTDGGRLFEHLDRAESIPEARIAPGRRRREGSFPRLLPEAEERAGRLRAARVRRARELGLDPGLLLPNKTIMQIVRANPGSPEELARVPQVRAWQVEVLGHLTLDILRA
jgi:ribonuclease D